MQKNIETKAQNRSRWKVISLLVGLMSLAKCLKRWIIHEDYLYHSAYWLIRLYKIKFISHGLWYIDMLCWHMRKLKCERDINTCVSSELAPCFAADRTCVHVPLCRRLRCTPRSTWALQLELLGLLQVWSLRFETAIFNIQWWTSTGHAACLVFRMVLFSMVVSLRWYGNMYMLTLVV